MLLSSSSVTLHETSWMVFFLHITAVEYTKLNYVWIPIYISNAYPTTLKIYLFVSASLFWLMVSVCLLFRSFWHCQCVVCKIKIIHSFLTFLHQISGPPAFMVEEAAEVGYCRTPRHYSKIPFFPLETHLGNKHRQKRIIFLP